MDRIDSSLEESRAYWDKRADTFGRQCGSAKPHKHGYAKRFIELLDAPASAAVLDMGCATGTLAVPLAAQGHEVIACDFSPRMIEKLEAIASEDNLPIVCKLMAWEDDWHEFGIEEDCVDIALASRSLGFGNVRRSLEKLDKVARDRVAITVSAGPVPAYEPRIIEHLGRAVPEDDEVTDIIATLFAMGRFPRLDYIPCERPMRFADLETARMELARMIGPQPTDEREQALFDDYVRAHFKEVDTEDGMMYQLDYTLIAPWAFITWTTKSEL